MSNIVTCEYCHGTGTTTCKTCGGIGKVDCPDCDGSGKSYFICPECNEGRVPDPRAMDDDETMVCPTCHGEYKKENGACKKCNGTGKVDCKPCKGSGKVGCQACNATGKFDVDKIVKAAIVTDWYDVNVDKKIKKGALSDKGVLMLKTAAEQGHGGACYVLGVLEGGNCIDYAEGGDSYFERGAKAGDADCLYAHAIALSRKQTPDNLKEMMDCLARSADKGNLRALVALALRSLHGYSKTDGKDGSPDLDSDNEKVVQYCERMVSVKHQDGQNPNWIVRANALGKYLPRILNDDAMALSELGTECSDLYKKTGCMQDKTLAEALLDKAAKGGDTEAVRQLAASRSKDNLAGSIEMLDKAAKGGDKKAKEQLQSIMQDCLQDKSRLDELEACAKSGNVTAMVFLASAYKKGKIRIGRPREDRKGWFFRSAEEHDCAEYWLEMAAKAGDGPSMLDISVKYRDGKGRSKDVNKAFVLTYEGFLKGSRRRALRLFAELYRYGRFGEPDDKKANELYVRSAKAGYLPSIVELGKSYQNGWGVKTDLGEAKRLYELAASEGSEEAELRLDRYMPDGVKSGTNPISGVTAPYAKDKGPLPDYVQEDYEKAKAGDLWTAEFESKRKSVKRDYEFDRFDYKQKRRGIFVMIGMCLGVLGLHLLYAKRIVWFVLYWLMVTAAVAQLKVEAFRELLGRISPILSKVPVFAVIAGLIFVGSLFLMKKDGKGLPMV